MKHWSLGWVTLAVVLAGLTVGCESGLPPEEADEYDANIDAPPTNLVARPDPDLVKDQKEVAQAQARESATVTGTTGTGTPGAGPAADPNKLAVQEVMTALIDGAKAGQMGEILKYLDAADKAELSPTFQAMAQKASAAAELDAALKQKMDANDIPASLSQALGYGSKAPVLTALGDLTLDMLSYDHDPNVGTMTVTGGSAPLEFSKSADAWLLKLSNADKQIYAAVGVLAQQQIKFIRGLRDGLQTGAVNRNNIDEKVMTAVQDEIQPAMKSLEDAAAAASGGGIP